jgi:hypothetical protein
MLDSGTIPPGERAVTSSFGQPHQVEGWDIEFHAGVQPKIKISPLGERVARSAG